MQLRSDYKYHLTLKISFIFFVAVSIFLMPMEVSAQTATTGNGAEALEDVLCEIIGWFTGPLGKGLATLAIISLGIGALFGKLDPGRGIIIVCGIAFMFGAADILKLLQLGGGTMSVTSCPTTVSESGKQVADSLCRVALLLQTGVGKAIMIAAILITGIMSLFGKISFGMAVMLVAGIAIIVGAHEIADELAAAAEGADITCADITVG